MVNTLATPRVNAAGEAPEPKVPCSVRRCGRVAAGVRRPRHRGADAGFTLLEIMVAVLISMIGLMGTVAVQQTVLNASRNASESAIAMRLATQALEELNARVTHPGPPVIDQLSAIATGSWSNPDYLDVNGRRSAQSVTARFARRVRVTDSGAGLPYNVSVQVSFALDSATPKIVQLDVERRKRW